GALLFLVASGFTLIFGLMRIANLAHGGFFVVGAYAAITTLAMTRSFWLALVFGALAAALVGGGVEVGLLRRVRSNEMAEVLVTVGVLFVITDVIAGVFGGDSKIVDPASGGAPAGVVVIGDFRYPSYPLFVIAATIIIGVALYVAQRWTKVGAIVRAGVDDRAMVAALGINISRVFTAVFVLGAALAGLAGVIATGRQAVTPYAGTEVLLYALVVVIIGGLGSIPGAAVGAVALGLLDAFAKQYVPELSYFTIFAPMVIVLMFRPQGLFGRIA
ncbi:MAG TPA: branched-chain amino acid ABC transporter permease, partial [Microbacterium sp.]|nr:branched-chain amino acid ABC transporter permease [Microbacterium sp.]